MFIKCEELEKIVKLGKQAIVALYGGKPDDDLEHLRHVKYLQKLMTHTTAVEPKNLPPTPSAAEFHSMRTYYQVQVWRSLNAGSFDLEATDWGWKIKNNMLIPIMTALPAAPEYLLRAIRCNCTTNCSSSRCSCRRHGLTCSLGCGDCRGESCLNSTLD